MENTLKKVFLLPFVAGTVFAISALGQAEFKNGGMSGLEITAAVTRSSESIEIEAKNRPTEPATVTL